MTDKKQENRQTVSNDKGSTRPLRSRSSQPGFQRLLQDKLSRRDFSLGVIAAGLMPTALVIAGCESTGMKRKSTRSGFTEVPFDTVTEDVLPAGYSRDVLISWGDPLHANMPGFDFANQTVAAATRQFGYNNDYLAYLPMNPTQQESDHGLLVVNHEYPLPWLMWPDLEKETAASRMSREQVDVSMAAVGLSVLEVKRRDGQWQVVGDSDYNRRISMFTPIDIRGPARGHERMRTADDPDGSTVIGTHDNCNGGVTPWGTVLSGEEGSADFFKGDFRLSPDRDHLERYYYDAQSLTGDYGWPRFHPRLDFEQEMNEPNRFEWIVEVDPFDPESQPVKRTALGRFAHEGAHTVLNADGRVVVFMADDWEFEYLYRFVTEGKFDPADRSANKHLLDDGTLSVARFSEQGSLEWLPIRFGEGPLTEANGFTDQGDVMIQTRRAADLLGATPMDAPEGFISNPVTGVLYVALTQNRDRTLDQVNGPNPRSGNEFGHLLELSVPATRNGQPDYAANRFSWSLMLLCGDRSDAAPFHKDTAKHSRFTDPDNLAVDPSGRLWVCTDDGNGSRDALYVLETSGPDKNLSRRFYMPPLESECCSPAFTPDGRTLFLSVQHPGEEATALDNVVTTWPNRKAGEPPRPSVIVITRDDEGAIGT